MGRSQCLRMNESVSMQGYEPLGASASGFTSRPASCGSRDRPNGGRQDNLGCGYSDGLNSGLGAGAISRQGTERPEKPPEQSAIVSQSRIAHAAGEMTRRLFARAWTVWKTIPKMGAFIAPRPGGPATPNGRHLCSIVFPRMNERTPQTRLGRTPCRGRAEQQMWRDRPRDDSPNPEIAAAGTKPSAASARSGSSRCSEKNWLKKRKFPRRGLTV